MRTSSQTRFFLFGGVLLLNLILLFLPEYSIETYRDYITPDASDSNVLYSSSLIDELYFSGEGGRFFPESLEQILGVFAIIFTGFFPSLCTIWVLLKSRWWSHVVMLVAFASSLHFVGMRLMESDLVGYTFTQDKVYHIPYYFNLLLWSGCLILVLVVLVRRLVRAD